jgi:hypothetical protein
LREGEREREREFIMPEETAAKNGFLFSDVSHFETLHFGKAFKP